MTSLCSDLNMYDLTNLPKDISEEDLEELHFLLVQEEAERGLKDLYFFDKHILGYKDMEPRTHRPLCDFVDNKTRRKKRIEYPRGTFKSSVVTIGLSVKRVAENPNVRILIDNEVYGNSKAFLREIKGHMDNAEVLARYPQLEADKRINDGWTESSVIVKARTKQMKESTISCAGLDQIKVGMHYDLIIMDDLVSNRNVTTKEQIEKVIEHYKLALSLLEPGGELIIVGTRYHYSDLYGYLLENEYDSFNHLILPAILNEEACSMIKESLPHLTYKYEPGDLLFPERITKEFLDEQRQAQGSYIFNCQYMLNPINQEEADFSKEWLVYYKGELTEVEGKPYLRVDWMGDYQRRKLEGYEFPFTVPIRITTTFDPNNKKKKGSDNTGAMTIGTDPDSNWFILNMIRDKFNPKEIVDRIISEHDAFRPDVLGVEEVGRETIRFYLKERMQQLNLFFKLVELKTRGVPKEDRIRRLVPRFENKKIFLPLTLFRRTWEGKTINIVEAFEDEFMYFPLSKFDDLMDALAYQEDLMLRTNSRESKRRKGRSKTIR